MKKLVLMSMVVLSTSAFAKVSSTVGVTSDFIWRGLSLSGGTVAQGSMTYSHDSGLSVGLFASEQNTFSAAAAGADGIAGNGNYLTVPYLVYGTAFGEYNVTVAAQYFNFGDNGKGHSVMNYALSVARGGLKLGAEYMPDYFGKESTDMYLSLGYTHALDQGLNAVVAVGQTTFGDEKKTEMSNYMDMKAALQRTSADGIMVEIGVTNSNQQAVDSTSGDKTDVANTTKTYVSLNKAF